MTTANLYLLVVTHKSSLSGKTITKVCQLNDNYPPMYLGTLTDCRSRAASLSKAHPTATYALYKAPAFAMEVYKQGECIAKEGAAVKKTAPRKRVKPSIVDDVRVDGEPQ